MVLRNKKCKDCGLLKSFLNEGGYCRECYDKWKQKRLDKLAKSLDRCFEYSKVNVVFPKLIKVKSKSKVFELWELSPVLSKLFSSRQSFVSWYPKNKTKFVGFKSMVNFRKKQLFEQGFNVLVDGDDLA